MGILFFIECFFFQMNYFRLSFVIHKPPKKLLIHLGLQSEQLRIPPLFLNELVM